MSQYRRDYEVDILLRGMDDHITIRCIDSIINSTDPDRIMITYVNNGGVAPRIGGIQTVDLPFNHGSVRAINIGLSIAMLSDAPYVLLLDNDTEIPEGDDTWLDRWLGYFDDEDVGAAGAVAGYASGFQTPLSFPDVYQKAWEVENEGRGHGAPPPVPLLASFGMMLRKQAIEDAGLFDERYEPGQCEDYDYVFGLMDAGWKTVVAHSVWLHHEGSQTFRDDLGRLLEENMHKLVDKWGVDRLHSFGLEVSL